MTWDQPDFTSALSQNAEELLNVSDKDWEPVLKLHGVTPEALKDMVSSIREWLRKQPYLPGDKIRDRQIIGFLLFRSFSVERVKRTIDDYFTARARFPEILRERDPLHQTLAQYLKRGYIIMLPNMTPENHRVGLFRILPFESNLLVFIFKLAFMIADYLIWNDVSLGDRMIFDLEHVGLHETMQATPVMVSNVIFILTACFGAKLKSIHIINVPPIAAVVVNLFKKMMKSKLTERVFISSKEEILNIFPKECLPVEYGGEGGSCQDIADKWAKEIQSDSWRQFFLEQDSVLPDESKKVTTGSGDEVFGADGSFRKLCLD